MARLKSKAFFLKPCFKVKVFCVIFSVFLCKQVKCQDLSSPKFLKLNFQSLPFSSGPSIPQLGSLASSNSNRNSDFGHNFLYEVAVRYPIKLKGQTKIIGEISHKNEYVAGYYSSQLDEIDELELFQTSSSIILVHDFNEQFKFTTALQVSSSSARSLALTGGALRFSNIGLFEKKLSNGVLGIGTAISFDRRLSVLPILKYEADLGKNWAIEALLPSKLLFVKNLSKGSRLLFGAKGSTATYLINDNESVASNLLGSNYRRMSVHGVVGYEKMLTPMVGISLEMGASIPLRSGIYSVNNTQTALYDFNNKLSPHFRVGVFLAIPK